MRNEFLSAATLLSMLLPSAVASALATHMHDLGFEVTENVGKTGLAAIYRNDVGPAVMVRTELVAHGCGHDLHMATWVGVAAALVDLKNQWRGTLMFVDQPAEEVVADAQAMLDDGLFTRFGKPEVAPALQSDPIEAGSVGFKGRGGHGSAPHKAIDPTMMAAHFLVDVQNLLNREKDPFEFGVLTFGAVEAGSKVMTVLGR